MNSPTVGDLCYIHFFTNSRKPEMKSGKGILLARVGIHCLFLLVFYPDHKHFNVINTLDLEVPTKAVGETRVGYSEICHGNIVSTTVHEVEAIVSRVSQEALQEALDDVLNTPQRNVLLGYLAPENRVVSSVYEKYVGQEGVMVPGLCGKGDEKNKCQE